MTDYPTVQPTEVGSHREVSLPKIVIHSRFMYCIVIFICIYKNCKKVKTYKSIMAKKANISEYDKQFIIEKKKV